MYPRTPRLLLCLSLLAVTACGDSGGAESDTDVGVDAPTDGSGEVDAGEDAGPDVPAEAGVDADAADDATPDVPDVEADVEEDVDLPECDDDERIVDGRCRGEFDRVCFSEENCREGETCEWREGERLDRPGTCVYTPGPAVVCPGADGCASNEGGLRVGVAMRDITPIGWELPRPGRSEDPDAFGNPRRFNGDISNPATFCDCGRDRICPPTDEFAECESVGEYTGPDADGSEGDGYMQGAWLAGFGNSRLASYCPEEWLEESCEGPDCCVNERAHDPIWARGTILETGDVRIAMVTLDVVGWFYNEQQWIYERMDPEWGIDWLIMTGTHNHEAPDTAGQWGPGVFGADLPTDTGFDAMWRDDIRVSMLELLEEAVGDLQDADAYAMQVNTGAEGFATKDSRNPFIFDDLITGIRFVPDGVDPEGSGTETIGTMVNWHSHPEVLSSGNVYITSDYPHFYREGLEDGLAETDLFPARDGFGGMAQFVSGSVGGLLGPLGRAAIGRDGVAYDGGYAKAAALGDRLAEVTIEAFRTPCEGESRYGCYTRIEEESLSFAVQEVVLDITNVLFQSAGISLRVFDRPIYNWRFNDGSIGDSNMPKVVSAISQVRLGNLTFQSFPGELFPEVLTGFNPETIARNPIMGDPNDVNCAEDRLTRLEPGVEPRFGCYVRENNPNPPDVASQYDYVPLADELAGDYLFVQGLGNDFLGYLVPSYDFQVDPDLGTLIEQPGDHYEETNSLGDELGKVLEVVERLDAALNGIE